MGTVSTLTRFANQFEFMKRMLAFGSKLLPLEMGNYLEDAGM
jgi:hypothetical protein